MKLNYFKFTVDDWREVALIMMIFSAWLFKCSCSSPPQKKQKGEEDLDLPGRPEILIGLCDLDLEDIEAFLPPPLWDYIKDTIVKIEGGHLPGSGR